jgi:hypothetical protein
MESPLESCFLLEIPLVFLLAALSISFFASASSFFTLASSFVFTFREFDVVFTLLEVAS